ncbi:MAG: DUF1850 domain-containing protein [Desulfarculus sp.]|nr:DUF1850 domain-containing protein [Desulfarculus sp.]
MRRIVCPILLILLAAGLTHAPAWAGAPDLALRVYAEDQTRPGLVLPVRAGSHLTVSFFHSYDRADFSEHYQVLGPGGILLTNMTFRSMLNGQGFDLGRYRAHADGSAELAEINQRLGEIVFRLGSPDLANHRLRVDGQTHRLLDYFAPGTLLRLRVEPLAPAEPWAQLPRQTPHPEERP